MNNRSIFHVEKETGLKVLRRGNEPIDVLVKRFKRKLEKNGMGVKYFVKEFYEKPSDKKRRKRQEAQRRRERESRMFENKLKNKGRFRNGKNDPSSKRQNNSESSQRI